MSASNDDWEERVSTLWAAIDTYPRDAFVAAIDALAAEHTAGGAADFERAAARDSTGYSDRAIPLYRRALDAGLTGERRRRAIIQLASSLRNTGHVAESVVLLRAERERTSDHLDDAVTAFLALALADTGCEREAAALALGALAPHLPRYQRSLTNYARLLVEPAEA